MYGKACYDHEEQNGELAGAHISLPLPKVGLLPTIPPLASSGATTLRTERVRVEGHAVDFSIVPSSDLLLRRGGIAITALRTNPPHTPKHATTQQG